MATAGASYDFDGTGDHLSYGDISVFDGMAPFTFAFWLNLDSTAANQGISGKYVSYAAHHFYIMIGGNNKIEMSVRDGSGNATYDAITVTTEIGTGAWHHIAVNYNVSRGATDRWQSFLDGVVKTTSAVADNAAGGFPTTSEAFVVGDLDIWATFPLDGRIAYFQGYDKVLSQDEVKEIMYKPFSIPGNNLFNAPLYDTNATDVVGGLTATAAGDAAIIVEGPPVFL